MPFSFTNKSSGDLIKSQDWNDAMAAISVLYDKLHAATGHRHTGGLEDGPQITASGLQDLAVTTAKIDDGSVNNDKVAADAIQTHNIVNGNVTLAKMAAFSVSNSQLVNGSVTVGKMAANSVDNSQLVNNAVTTSKIGNGQVTAAKLAAGVAPEIGVAYSFIGDGQTAAIPAGFLVSECQFFASLDWIRFVIPGGVGGTVHMYAYVDSVGLVTIYNFTTYSNACQASVIAIGKKGGW